MEIIGGCNPGTRENVVGYNELECGALIVSAVIIPRYVYFEAPGSILVKALCYIPDGRGFVTR
jgi:hypothetical protein